MKKTEASTLNFLSLSQSQGEPDAMFQGHSASGGFYTVSIRGRLTWVTLEALFTRGVCEHVGVPGAQICGSVGRSNAADRGEG